MAQITGFTAARMKQIEDTTIVNGVVTDGNLILIQRNGVQIDLGPIIDDNVVSGAVNVDGDLILTQHDGSVINAGNVKGPQGAPGVPGPKTIRIAHTWHVPGDVKVASGDTDFINPFTVSLPVGQTAVVAGFAYRINSGTSATVTLRKRASGGTMTDISAGRVVNTTHNNGLMISPHALTDADRLELVVTAVTGTPKNMFFTVFIDYTY